MTANNAINLGKSTFIASTSAIQSNVTGDGTQYTIIFGSATVNDNNCYNTSTGIFTAPEAGNYLFNATVEIDDITSTMTLGIIYIGGIPASRINTYVCSSSGVFVATVSQILTLAKNDTVSVSVAVAGGSKVASIPTGTCHFSGVQLL